jgi:hypothetical protein
VGDSATDARAAPISFEAFGVTMGVTTNRREARDRIPEILPPGWRPCSDAAVKHRLAIVGDERGTYAVDVGGKPVLANVSLDIALDSLDSAVRMRVAREARERIFIHAGAVGHAGGALVLPGSSFTGKTTLVAALVRAGATYYSDEYAVLDSDGLVHPYAKPLSIRGDSYLQRDHRVEALGGTTGEQRLPVRVMVVATYRGTTEWAPEPLEPGDAALALIAHAVPAQDRPAETLRAATRAVEGALTLKGDRGEAEDLVPLLLAELEARAV